MWKKATCEAYRRAKEGGEGRGQRGRETSVYSFLVGFSLFGCLRSKLGVAQTCMEEGISSSSVKKSEGELTASVAETLRSLGSLLIRRSQYIKS